MEVNKLELVMLRVLQGVDPVTGAILSDESPWKAPEVLACFQSIVSQNEEEKEGSLNDCIFPF